MAMKIKRAEFIVWPRSWTEAEYWERRRQSEARYEALYQSEKLAGLGELRNHLQVRVEKYEKKLSEQKRAIRNAFSGRFPEASPGEIGEAVFWLTARQEFRDKVKRQPRIVLEQEQRQQENEFKGKEPEMWPKYFRRKYLKDYKEKERWEFELDVLSRVESRYVDGIVSSQPDWMTLNENSDQATYISPHVLLLMTNKEYSAVYAAALVHGNSSQRPMNRADAWNQIRKDVHSQNRNWDPAIKRGALVERIKTKYGSNKRIRGLVALVNLKGITDLDDFDAIDDLDNFAIESAIRANRPD